MERELVAQSRIAIPDAETVVRAIGDHMVEHGGTVEERDGARQLRFAGARANLRCLPGGTEVDIAAETLEGLYFMRMMLASHIIEFSAGPAPIIEWTGDGDKLDRPPNFQIVRVVDRQDVTPRMRRIRLAGTDVARFAGLDALHLNLLLQHPDAKEPQWPSVGGNGLVQWPDPERRPRFRKYTVRQLDLSAGTLDIDFVLHADAGPGARFAESARPGDEVGVMGPGGGGLIDADWYLFAGDETALPAIARMLEALPSDARGHALIEVADRGEVQDLQGPAGVDIRWLYRDTGTERLAGAVAGTCLPDDGSRIYAWAGCEFEAFRAIRSDLRKQRGLQKHESLIVSYWRNGESDD